MALAVVDQRLSIIADIHLRGGRRAAAEVYWYALAGEQGRVGASDH